MSQPMPGEPHQGVKAAANPETEVLQRDQSSYVARGGQSSGAVGRGPQPGDEQPSQTGGGGTAGGEPLAGVTADPDDVQDAVSGDTGPAQPGQR